MIQDISTLNKKEYADLLSSEIEYLLNLILFHYVDHGFFPSGHICITDEWLYSDSVTTDSKSRWYSFRPRKKGRNYFAGWWIKIPSLAEIESSNVEGVPS